MGTDKQEADEHSEMMEAMTRFMPLRALASFSQGAVSEQMLAALIEELNE